MKKFIILAYVILACLFNVKAQQGETYWTPDPSIYANNMTIITEVTFNGITQDNMDLEIGAFCGDELRGSAKMMYVPSPIDKYVFFLMVYGNTNDEITFKIYDHGTETVQDLICHTNVYFEVNATIGGMAEPYTIEFTTPVDIVTNSDPEEGGVVIGSGAYHVGETVTLTATANEGFFFVNWTENDEEISTNSTYSFTIEEAVGLPAVRNITAHFDVLSIPTNLAAEAIDAQSIALSWDAAENALSYNVYRGEEFVANVATNSYTDNGLNPFTDYCYTVTSVRGELETEASEEACAKTLDLPIATPTNVAATAVDTQSIALSWDAMENALSYNVYKAGELLANVTNNSYTDEGLEYYTEYCYTVTTVRNEQETEPSAEVCEKTMDLPIATPTNFTATAIDTQSIALNWDAMENALSYNIYKAGELLANVTETSYTDEGLNSFTEYCYTVTTVRNESESEQAEACAKTLDLPITTPTNLTATAVDTQSIALSWDAMENALSYNVYRGEEFVANVTETSYTNEGLSSFTDYCFTVTSVRNEQESEASEEACAKTLDLPVATPTNFTVTAVDTQSIALSWDTAENALSYNIYKAGELLANVTETSYTDEGLEYNTEYCYTVSAVRNEQESEQTEEVCIKTLGESINEHELSFNIYPNPVRDNLFIETEMNIEEVSIYNIMGVMIYKESSFNNEPIDVSNFAEGTYIIKINTDNGNVNYSRIIVK